METAKNHNSLVAERIKHIRMMKGISQSKIAQALSIASPAYSRIENNQTQLTINNLFIISEVLNTSIQDLLNIKCDFSVYNQGNVVMTNFNHVNLNLSIDLKELEKLMSKNQKKNQ